MRKGSIKPIEKRLDGKVFYSPCGCHLWIGKTEPTKGYGEIEIGGKVIKAHRLAYIIHKGPIPNGAHVLHLCDTPLCVNPDHLRLGTHLDNMKDKVKKSRQHRPIGSRNPKAKLTDKDVSDIRFLKAGGYRIPYLSKLFGVCQSNISLICNKTTWKHL